VVEWRLLAQKGLGRLLHRGGTRAGVRIGGYEDESGGRAEGEQRARSSGMGMREAGAVALLHGSRAASTAAMDGWRRCRRDKRWELALQDQRPQPACTAGPTRSGCSLTCLGPLRATCMIRLPRSAPGLDA
jgi:hypothetical protein